MAVQLQLEYDALVGLVEQLSEDQKHDLVVRILSHSPQFGQFQGLPLGEIQTGGWESLDLGDTDEWVLNNRRSAENRGNSW